MSARRLSRDVAARAAKVRILAMDVDGVLTGGEIILLNSGEELKIWSVKDRMGFALLKWSGLPVKLAWITARKSLQVEQRAKEIGVDFLFQDCLDKKRALAGCLKELNLKFSQAAYVGDDFVDFAVLRAVGLAVCPPDTPRELKSVCHYQTRTPAGRGAVREAIEVLLKAQGYWKKALKRFSLLIAAAAFGLSLPACSSSQRPPTDLAEKPDQWVEQFTITETSKGVPVWVLNSEIAEVYNQKRRILLENIRIQFMNPSAIKKINSRESLLLAKKTVTQAARLTAPKGQVEMDSRDLTAWGGVEVESQDGTRLYAERLHYSAEKQKILSESPVKIVRQDSILLGEGLEASPDLETVKIFRHQASIHPKNLPLQP